MTETEVLKKLEETTRQYYWSEQNGRIIGRGRNHVSKDVVFNPLSAVKRFTRRKNLNMSKTLESNILAAANGKSNRGYAQVLRGRIKKAVGLA